ncbi:MAG TPA: hypothetical protein VHV08_03880, partial [Pirellulales bacterium]|nr:hypothetical protein [Pirellulales bacterium]
SGRWQALLWQVYREFARMLEAEITRFAMPLEAWIRQLLAQPLPADWRHRMAAYLDEWDSQFVVEPAAREALAAWVESWARQRGSLPTGGGDQAQPR